MAAAALAARAAATAYAKGLSFEELTLAQLAALHFALRRTGGAGDGGVDFRGHWRLPQTRTEASSALQHVPVLGQCKNEARRTGAQRLREFEGVLLREPLAVGVFATAAGYSLAALQHFHSSALPMLLAVVAPDGLAMLQMNRAAQGRLPGVQLVFRLERAAPGSPSAGGVRRVPVVVSA